MLRIGFSALAFLAFAACASPGDETAAAAPGERDCFRSESVTGFNVIDEHSVEVHVGANRRYLLTTDRTTNNLSFSQHIALRSASGYICTGNGLGVDIIGGTPRSTYPITSLTRAPDDPPPPPPQAQ